MAVLPVTADTDEIDDIEAYLKGKYRYANPSTVLNRLDKEAEKLYKIHYSEKGLALTPELKAELEGFIFNELVFGEGLIDDYANINGHKSEPPDMYYELCDDDEYMYLDGEKNDIQEESMYKYTQGRLPLI
jgi:hypothetical protein